MTANCPSPPTACVSATGAAAADPQRKTLQNRWRAVGHHLITVRLPAAVLRPIRFAASKSSRAILMSISTGPGPARGPFSKNLTRLCANSLAEVAAG
jgi:hypothetical protein